MADRSWRRQDATARFFGVPVDAVPAGRPQHRPTVAACNARQFEAAGAAVRDPFA